jgi:hypothetical protein
MKIDEIITESLSQNQKIPAELILKYVKQIHPEGEFYNDQDILAHSQWTLTQFPVSNLHIYDPETDDDYQDLYNRVLDTDPYHVDKLIPNIATIVQKKPLVIDDAGYILDGNHRALAAQKAGLQTVPVWKPIEKNIGEAGGLNMSRRGFLGGLGAMVASSGLPKLQADALTQILNTVGADFLEQMANKASRGNLRFFLSTSEYNKVTRMGDTFPDEWFEHHRKNPIAAYRKLTGEQPKFAQVLDVLRTSGLEPAEFLRSEPVQRVARQVQAAWQEKWKASGASADPFMDPGYKPGDLNVKKQIATEPTHVSPSGQITNMRPDDDDYEINYGKKGFAAKGKAVGRMAPVAAPLKPTHINNRAI